MLCQANLHIAPDGAVFSDSHVRKNNGSNIQIAECPNLDWCINYSTIRYVNRSNKDQCGIYLRSLRDPPP